MRVAVIDIGSNSVRLLTTDVRKGRVRQIGRAKEHLGLALEVERHGAIGLPKLLDLHRTLCNFKALAERAGCGDALDCVITAPGRTCANPDDLLTVVESATGTTARTLTGTDEAILAWRGAVVSAPKTDGIAAVCDVGGGSTEVAVGRPGNDPDSVWSVPLGALTLSHWAISLDPPGAGALAVAVSRADGELGDIRCDRPALALATGGTARALAKLFGSELDEDALRKAVDLVANSSARKLVRRGLSERRAAAIGGGVALLAGVQKRLGVPLRVVGTGLREGVALERAASPSL